MRGSIIVDEFAASPAVIFYVTGGIHNIMKRNILLIISGVIILALAIGIYTIGMMNRRMGKLIIMSDLLGRDKILCILKEQLELTDKQVDRFKEINNRYDELMGGYKKAVTLFVYRLRDNYLGDTYNEKEIREMLGEMNSADTELKVLSMKKIFEHKQVLNPEQKKKYIKMVNDVINFRLEKWNRGD